MKPKTVLAINLKEIYAYQGPQAVKLLIDPMISQSVQELDVQIKNSDGKPLSNQFKRWGTKLTVDFVIGPDTPDGVSTIDIRMRKKCGSTISERFNFWVVK